MRHRRRTVLALIVSVLLALGACDDAPTRAGADRGPTTRASAGGSSEAAFPTLHQGFEHDVEPWVDGDDGGFLGWCGEIERVDRRDGTDEMPSAGSGYATVASGSCNDFYSGLGFPPSAPASGPSPEHLSSTFPAGGFVQQLDVHLDPDDFSDGLAFLYINSLCVLDDTGVCATDAFESVDFRYFAVPVARAGGALHVAGHAVSEAGWYTFRHVYGSEDGALTVDFQLRRDGRTLASTSIDGTLLSGETTSDFRVSDLGSGYAWFHGIPAGVEVPIDEHVLRPGR